MQTRLGGKREKRKEKKKGSIKAAMSECHSIIFIAKPLTFKYNNLNLEWPNKHWGNKKIKQKITRQIIVSDDELGHQIFWP